MTSILRKVLTSAAFLVVPLASVACGGSGSSSGKATATPPSTAVDASRSSSNTDVSQPPGVSVKPAGPPSSVKALGGGEFCKKVADSLNSVAKQASTGVRTPDALRAQYEESKKTSQQALSSAPGEIKGDLQILLKASSAIGDALAKANYDMTKLPAGALSATYTPDVQAASTRVIAYVKKHCGIDIMGGSATTTP